jgi:hypothetical protein
MSMSSINVSPHHAATSHHGSEGGPAWLPAVAGLCASLVGLGLARFAYTPLIPALIAAKWFSPAEAVYLGAANLAGYLAGARSRATGYRAGGRRSCAVHDGAGFVLLCVFGADFVHLVLASGSSPG